MSQTRESARFSNRALIDGKLNYQDGTLSSGKPTSSSLKTQSFFQIFKGKAVKFGDNYKLKTFLGNSIKNSSYSYIILGNLYKDIYIDGKLGIAGSNKVKISLKVVNGYVKKYAMENNENYQNSLVSVVYNGVEYLALALSNVIAAAPVIVDAVMSEDTLETLSYIIDPTQFTTVKPWAVYTDGSKRIYESFNLPLSGWTDAEAVTLTDGTVLLTGGFYNPVLSLDENNTSQAKVVTNKSYIFNPADKTFRETSNLPYPVNNHRLCSIKNNCALQLGGGAIYSDQANTNNQWFKSVGDILLYTSDNVSGGQKWTILGQWSNYLFRSHGVTYDDTNDYLYVYIPFGTTTPNGADVTINHFGRRKIIYGVNASDVTLGAVEVLASIPTSLMPSGSSGSNYPWRNTYLHYYNGKIYLPLQDNASNSFSGYGKWNYGLVYDVATNTWSKWINTIAAGDGSQIVRIKDKLYTTGWVSQLKEGTTATTVPLQFESDVNVADMLCFDLTKGTMTYKSPLNLTNNASVIDKNILSAGSSCAMAALKDGRIAIFGGDRGNSFSGVPEYLNTKGLINLNRPSVGFIYYPDNDTSDTFSGIVVEREISDNTYSSFNQPFKYKGDFYYLSTGKSNDFGTPIDGSKLIKYSVSYGTETILNVDKLTKGLKGAATAVSKSGKVFILGGDKEGVLSNSFFTNDLITYSDTWAAITPLPISVAYGRAKVTPDNKVLYIGGVKSDGTFNRNVYVYDLTSTTWSILTTLPYDFIAGDITENTFNGNTYVFYGLYPDTTTNNNFSIISNTGTVTTKSLSDLSPAISNSYIVGASYLNKDVIRLVDSTGRHWDYDLVNSKITVSLTRRNNFYPQNGIVKLDSDKCCTVDKYGRIYITHLYQREFSERIDHPDRDKIISGFKTDVTGAYNDVVGWESLVDIYTAPMVIPCNEYDNTSIFFTFTVQSRAPNNTTTPQNIIGIYNRVTEKFTFYPSSQLSSVYGATCSDRDGNPIIVGGVKNKTLVQFTENGISYIDSRDVNNVFNMFVYKFDMATKTISQIATMPYQYGNGAAYFDKDTRKLYMFGGYTAQKVPYWDIASNSLSTQRCMVYDVDTNTFSLIASLPNYGIGWGNCFRKDKDKIIIFGGYIGLVDDKVDLPSLRQDLGNPNKIIYEYSISSNTYKDVSAEYSFIQNFRGLTNGKNEFCEVHFAERIPNCEKNEILFYNQLNTSKDSSSGFIHTGYTPKFLGGQLNILNLDTKEFRVVDTVNMVPIASAALWSPYLSASKSLLHYGVDGKFYEMNKYIAGSASVFNSPTKIGIVRNYL